MDLVVLGWIALQITGSPFMVGLAVFVRSAPMIALGPFAGVVADRLHRGRVLLFTQSLGVATALALSLLFATGHGGYWPLVGLEMLFGVLWALDFPARRTALFSLVGAGRVATAISLETVSMQLAKMVGEASKKAVRTKEEWVSSSAAPSSGGFLHWVPRGLDGRGVHPISPAHREDSQYRYQVHWIRIEHPER